MDGNHSRDECYHKDTIDDHEKRLSSLENNHENRIDKLETYNEQQGDKIDEIDKKLDQIMNRTVGGLFAIILMLVPIMIALL